jgi:glycosyltransferase involved in cell wall biosynthesis
MPEKTIVHISADFPDPLAPAKTTSVLNLISGTQGFRHIVYSLNRVSWSSRIVGLDFGPDRKAIAYGAPPRGLWLATYLERLADWILADLRARQISVDALHLHKFTVEGLVGSRIARALERPFVVNIWGDSDLKIVSVRRDLGAQWKTILREASVIVPCAPWAQEKFDRMFGVDRSKAVVIPPIVQNEEFSPSPIVAEPRFVTMFNLDSHRRKNFGTLVNAIVRLSKQYPRLSLDVYGRGSPAAVLALDKIITSAGAESRISLKGPLRGEVLSDTLRNYAAFLMPTRRETFGMVFIEALFSGLPVLHTKGWGIDGFFKPGDIGYACDATQLSDVQHGIERLLLEQEPLKSKVALLHDLGQFERFKRRHIVDTYRAALNQALKG